MRSDREEDPLVVTLTCLLTILGVMALRIGLRLDYQLWSVAYLGMALTASIRRTSRGNDCSTLSALRGVACLVVGLYVTQSLGYPGSSFHQPDLVPEELVANINRFR